MTRRFAPTALVRSKVIARLHGAPFYIRGSRRFRARVPPTYGVASSRPRHLLGGTRARPGTRGFAPAQSPPPGGGAATALRAFAASGAAPPRRAVVGDRSVSRWRDCTPSGLNAALSVGV